MQNKSYIKRKKLKKDVAIDIQHRVFKYHEISLHFSVQTNLKAYIERLNFLGKHKLPKVTPVERECLSRPISTKEIKLLRNYHAQSTRHRIFC